MNTLTAESSQQLPTSLVKERDLVTQALATRLGAMRAKGARLDELLKQTSKFRAEDRDNQLEEVASLKDENVMLRVSRQDLVDTVPNQAEARRARKLVHRMRHQEQNSRAAKTTSFVPHRNDMEMMDESEERCKVLQRFINSGQEMSREKSSLEGQIRRLKSELLKTQKAQSELNEENAALKEQLQLEKARSAEKNATLQDALTDLADTQAQLQLERANSARKDAILQDALTDFMDAQARLNIIKGVIG